MGSRSGNADWSDHGCVERRHGIERQQLEGQDCHSGGARIAHSRQTLRAESCRTVLGAIGRDVSGFRDSEEVRDIGAESIRHLGSRFAPRS